MGTRAVGQQCPESAGALKMHADRPLQLCHFWQVYFVVLVLLHLSWFCQACIVSAHVHPAFPTFLSKLLYLYAHIWHAYMQPFDLSCYAASTCALGCHFGVYLQHFICYHFLAQAAVDDYVVALLGGLLKCSMASVISGLHRTHQRVMQQVQIRLLALNMPLSVYIVIWRISIYLKSHFADAHTKLRCASCLGSLHIRHMFCDDASQSLGHPAQFVNTVHICVWPADQYIVLSWG